MLGSDLLTGGQLAGVTSRGGGLRDADWGGVSGGVDGGVSNSSPDFFVSPETTACWAGGKVLLNAIAGGFACGVDDVVVVTVFCEGLLCCDCVA